MTAQDPRRRPATDPLLFIRQNTRVIPVPSLPEISLHLAHPASGLWRLAEPDAGGGEPSPPYWAYPWAGGLVLAHYFRDHPEAVAGRQALDLGTGSGIVAITAAKAGASAVTAADTDRFAVAAVELNAAANGVAIALVSGDLTLAGPPPVDVIAVGDLYYDRDLAERVTAFLDRCLAAGIEVLIGDPGRAHLPLPRLHRLAEYRVPDFGDARDSAATPSAVFRFERPKA